MSLGQFFLGLVAIFVGTVVYRWQKSVELQNQIKTEQRALYARLLSASKQLLLSQPFLDEEDALEKWKKFSTIDEVEREFYIASDQVALTAPKAIVEVADVHNKAMREWLITCNTQFSPGGDRNVELVRACDNKVRSTYIVMHKAMRSSLKID